MKLKANHHLKVSAERKVVYGNPDTQGGTETQYYELDYQPDTWEQHYRVVLKATKTTDELLFNYEFLVTNLEELSIEDLFKVYDKQGNAENYIKEAKEAKLGFFLDKTDSHNYLINACHMLISAIAYSIVQSLKQLALPSGEANDNISTLRFKLFHLPAKISHHAHKTLIQISKSNVFDYLLWQVLDRIQKL